MRVGSYPSRQGLNDRRGFNPPSFKMDPWDDHPAVCSACGRDLLGVWFDAPGGAFCDASCADLAVSPIERLRAALVPTLGRHGLAWYPIPLDALQRADEHAVAVWPGRDRDFSKDRKQLGSLGEDLVSRLAGITRTMSYTAGPDGGRDFRDVDVKARPVSGMPAMMRLVEDPFKATWYCCVVVDLRGKRYALAGHAHRDELRAAPVMEHGIGPTYTLPYEDLRPGLPPSLLA